MMRFTARWSRANERYYAEISAPPTCMPILISGAKVLRDVLQSGIWERAYIVVADNAVGGIMSAFVRRS